MGERGGEKEMALGLTRDIIAESFRRQRGLAVEALGLAYGEDLDEASIRDLFHKATGAIKKAYGAAKEKAKAALKKLGFGKTGTPPKPKQTATSPETTPPQPKTTKDKGETKPKQAKAKKRKGKSGPLGRSTMYKHMALAIYRTLRRKQNTKYGPIPQAAVKIAANQMVRHGYAARKKPGAGSLDDDIPIRLTAKGRKRSRLHAREPRRVLKRKEKGFQELVRRAGLRTRAKPVR